MKKVVSAILVHKLGKLIDIYKVLLMKWQLHVMNYRRGSSVIQRVNKFKRKNATCKLENSYI